MRLVDLDALGLLTYDHVKLAEILHIEGKRSVSLVLIARDIIYRFLAKAPTVDAAPVVHARWILKDEKGNGVCSHCHRQDVVDPLATHCRYCGAKVDLKGD